MERRKLLLGSGATLATVLAGCMSGGDDENGDDDDDENGDRNGTDDEGYDDGNGADKDGDENGDDGDEDGDVPGFDVDDLESAASDHGVKIEKTERTGDELSLELVAPDPDDVSTDEIPAWVGAGIVHSVGDVDAFTSEIALVSVTIFEEDGSELVSFLVDVDWVVAYDEGDLSEEELAEKIRETVS